MPKKKQGDLQGELKQQLAELSATQRKKRQAHEDFVDSIQSYEPLQKAEARLSYVADNIDTYGDQEALVYLMSRGRDCSERINRLVLDWKRAARESIEGCARGIPFVDFRTDETKWVGATSIAEASDIRNHSPYLLRDFWGGADWQELSIDATMLRTVEWCKIGGFDEWWERLADTQREGIVDGIDSVPASYWLFNMCRSDYAIGLMEGTLERILEGIEICTYRQQLFPWRILRETGIENQPLISVDYVPYASTIVFANARLRGDKWYSDLVRQALETIQKYQDEHGAWRCWVDHQRPSVEATAMALHAIAIGRPRGWERVGRQARDWLWSVQDHSGCWTDPGCPDSVYLTVLVLDALELANGGSRVTFSLREDARRRDLSSGVSSRQHPNLRRRFKVALSFPGEVRPFVEAIANILAKRVGRDKVFYDKYYEAELARPNLDVYLQSIYHKDSELIVIFLCADYENKEWCGLEWRAIRDLIKKRRDEDVMPLRLDDTTISGLFSIDGYVDVRDRQPEEVADLICQRLKAIVPA